MPMQLLDSNPTCKITICVAVTHGIQCVFRHASTCRLSHAAWGGAYWVNCWYAPYVTFIVCNGFALVFSVAAIVAVLIGPIILVCLDRLTWRKQIAILAIIHLTLSLVSLVIAFAAAGFVTASVNPPDLNCGNLKCKDGGVPCSAYSVRANGYAGYVINDGFAMEGLGIYNESWFHVNYTGGTRDRSILWPSQELVLDPVVARLNNDTFGSAQLNEIPGNDVVCRDYRYVTNNSYTEPWVGPVFGVLNDTHGRPINKTCLILLDTSFDQAAGYIDSPRRAFQHNPHTLWCSTNMSNIGLGWLPLTLYTGISLLGWLRPDTFNSTVKGMYSTNALEGVGYAYAGGTGVGGRLGCPNLPFNKSAPTFNAGRFGIAGLYMDALQLIPEDDNAWSGENGDANYNIPGDYTKCYEGKSSKFQPVFWYADMLGWDRSGVLFRPSKNGKRADNTICGESNFTPKRTNDHPLHGAKLYASLRYQCSSLSKGVLCDFGMDPPLAVSPDGTYLSKRNMPDLRNIVIFGSPPLQRR